MILVNFVDKRHRLLSMESFALTFWMKPPGLCTSCHKQFPLSNQKAKKSLPEFVEENV